MPITKGKYPYFVFSVILAVGIIIYWNALSNPFQYDDGSSVVNNPYIRSPENILRFFYDMNFSRLHDDAGTVVHYRPLWLASFALNYALSGLNPFGYHLVNLAFHIGSAYLIFLILQALSGSSEQLAGQRRDRPSGLSNSSFFIALSSALIFLVHPFNSEVVNYISARSSVMSSFFYLLSFYFWIKYRHPHPIPPPRGGGNKGGGGSSATSYLLPYLASLLAFLLAMLTKEIAVTLPSVLLMYDLYSDRLSEKRWWPYLPFIPFLSIPLIMVFSGKVRLIYSNGIMPHFYTQMGVIVKYLKLFFLPTGLSIDHHFRIQKTFFTPEVFIPALFLLFFAASALLILKFLKKDWHWVSFFMLFFLITLLPSTVVPLNAPLQENRGYLPIMGITIAVSILTGKLYFAFNRKGIGSRWRPLIAIFFIFILMALSMGTIKRNMVWQDRLTLWKDAVEKAPGSPRAHANLAYAYTLLREEEMAMKEYLEALRLNPGDAGLHNDVATYYYQKGQLKDAEYHLKAAIALRPGYHNAYINLGLLYERLERPEDAIPLYKRALELKPGSSTIQTRLNRATISLRERKSAP